MNWIKYVLVSMIFVMACSSDNKTEETSGDVSGVTTTDVTATQIQTDIAPPATPPTAEPAQNEQGVWHYTCPTGCEGGAGSAVPCPKCGTTLKHNAGYHTNANSQGQGPQGVTQVPPPTAPPGAVPPGAEPAQNAKGVWHYTCPKGCAGGAGAAGPCGSCGATLAHNSGYH